MWKNWAEFLFGSVLLVMSVFFASSAMNRNDTLWLILNLVAMFIWANFTARAWRRI